MKTTRFDHRACGRCGGSGHYSFNQIHGTTCYGCGGSGYKLTKAGRAAADRYTALMSIPIEQLKSGTVARLDVGVSGVAWYTIESVEALPAGGFTFRATSKAASPVTWHGVAAGTLIRIANTAEEKAAKLKLALELQASLMPATA